MILTSKTIRILLFTFSFSCICFGATAQKTDYVYNSGTNWNQEFYNVINSTDQSSFKSVSLIAEKPAKMWDRDANNNKGASINPESWIFTLTYNDRIRSEIRIRKAGFTKAQGLALAKKYGHKMGQLPACLREGVDLINILKSDALFGGNRFNKSIEITIGKTSELYEKTKNMEETLFHEATHAALDYLYDKGWQRSRDKDPKFISEYSHDHPNREDIAENFLMYFALKYRRDRLSLKVINILKQSIPNRIAFFKGLNLNMAPFALSSSTVHSDVLSFDKNKYYRLTTEYQGEKFSLDIFHDKQAKLSASGNYSGQHWRIEDLGRGYYRLTTQFKGKGQSLDITGNNQVQLAPSGNYSGQHWKIEKLSNGYYRLTTEYKGEGQSLDVINKTHPQLMPSGRKSGQNWKITEIK